MSLCGTDQDKDRLKKRLNRIEGQVRGLIGMVEDDRDCIEVLRQVASVSGALKGVWTQVLEDHLRGCVQKSILNGDNIDIVVDEMMENLKKIL